MRWIGLLLTLLLTVFLLRMLLGTPDAAENKSAAPVGTTVGAPPPVDFATNAKSASEHTRRQFCLGACAADERTCRNLAEDDEAAKACTEKSAACSKTCP